MRRVQGDICVIGANGNVVECMYMGGNGRNGRLGSPSKHPSTSSYSVSSNGYLERILLIACNLE
jgi:hypothetical protein